MMDFEGMMGVVIAGLALLILVMVGLDIYRGSKRRTPMRLKAREQLKYEGKTVPAGAIFDATDYDGRDMISHDVAVPFNLEDPSMAPPENEAPPEAPAPEPERKQKK